MVRRGVYVGRFQPPHLGHLEIINYALTKVDELIIVIAAAQISHTMKNPFTSSERLVMLRTMLNEAGIDANKYWLIPTQDIKDNALWVSHLKRILPPFSVAFGNNPFTRLLFEEAGIEVIGTPMYKRDIYEASHIRQLLINRQDISKMVHHSIIPLLEREEVRKRLEGITNNDSNHPTLTGTELLKNE